METTVRKVRMQLGLGQQEFADYLSISRSCLSMAEMNLRSLPDQALVRLARLVVALENEPDPESQDPDTLTYAGPEDLQAQISLQQLEFGRIQAQFQIQLTRMQELIRNKNRLQGILSSPDSDPDLREIVQTSLVLLEDQLHKYSPLSLQNIERRLIEKQAWIDHLKGVFNRLNQS